MPTQSNSLHAILDINKPEKTFWAYIKTQTLKKPQPRGSGTAIPFMVNKIHISINIHFFPTIKKTYFQTVQTKFQNLDLYFPQNAFLNKILNVHGRASMKQKLLHKTLGPQINFKQRSINFLPDLSSCPFSLTPLVTIYCPDQPPMHHY